MNIFQEIKNKFLTGDVLTRLLLINCGVFIISLTLDISFTLISFGADKLAFSSLNYPWNPLLLAFRPWTPITSLFTSWGLWHLLFNMLTLYWLGGVFLRFFTSNNLRGLYIIGGLAGMLVFTGVFLLFPSLQMRAWADDMPMCSVCILTFSTALAFRAPDNTEPIPLAGPVKIKYIVIILALIDLAILPHANPATDAAHLMAVFTGWLFNAMLRKGKDITTPVTVIAVWIYGLFAKKDKPS
jgi:membrane associated rhomboid family serine protease